MVIRGYNLLSGNTKLSKSGEEYLLAGLSLAPHTYGYEGRVKMKNVCPNATPGCIASCVLHWAGRTVMSEVRNAAARRKELFFKDRPEFIRQLKEDINRVRTQAQKHNQKPFIRLNVGSDIEWERICPELFTENPDITFYDYTKSSKRVGLSNYHLTFSRSERNNGLEVLKRGGNVAVVFNVTYNPQHNKLGTLPQNYHGYKVVDGDVDDIRTPEFDGAGVVVGLRLKGTIAAKQTAIQTKFAHTPKRKKVR